MDVNTHTPKTLECWLGCNRRATFAGLLIAFLLMIPGGILLGIGSWNGANWLPVSAGLGLLLLGLTLFLALVRMLNTPRIGYQDGCLAVNLRLGKLIRVPADIVECFFLGQGPSHLGKGEIEALETSNIVIRLAERAVDWQHADVNRNLGHWCDGYITLYGALVRAD